MSVDLSDAAAVLTGICDVAEAETLLPSRSSRRTVSGFSPP